MFPCYINRNKYDKNKRPEKIKIIKKPGEISIN